MTSRITRAALVGGTILYFGAGSWAAPVKTAKIDQLFADWDRPGSPGAAIVIVQDGSVVYQQGYGYANLQHGIRITPHTVFDCASVAKQFTGLAVAMLMEQGKLSPEDDIRKHLPKTPDFGKPITIDHLLHHTSGVRDWCETLTLSGVDMQGPISLEMILEMERRQRELDFMPGEEHLYSNTGYNLLAAAVAKVSGQSFRSWTTKHLFEPLKMEHTHVCDDPAEIVPGLADSYAAMGHGKYKRITSQLSAEGSSSLLITAEDMGKWLVNFETREVGGNAAIERMHQPGKLNNGQRVDYGFGVSLGKIAETRIVSHSGLWAGYRSMVLRVPEKRLAVAVLANAGNMNTWDMATRIARLCLDLPGPKAAKSPEKKPETVTGGEKSEPAAWDAFIGTYRLGPGWLLTITRQGDELIAQATAEDEVKMTPMSANTFFVKAYNQPVEFVRQPSGAVTNLLYRGIKAPRVTLAKLTPERLANYAGDYWSEELREVTRVEIHDGALAVKLRSGDWLPLLPSGEDRFDTQAGFVIQFTCGTGTKANEARISGSRVRNIRYRRVALP